MKYVLIMFGHKHYIEKTWSKFVLTKNGYDPFIDYLKGLCIIFVIIHHCMPRFIMAKTAFFFWGASAVPIFLVIQVFHAYKKGLENVTLNYLKIWNKIVWPFLLTELVILIIYIVRDHHLTFNNLLSDAIAMIKSGGYGPGSYYPFIYLQFAFILPIIAWLFKYHNTYLCILFIITSQLSETACAYFHLSQLVYKLFFIRYLFLFYLGYLLSYKGFILNIYTFSISLICIAFSTYIVYSNQNFSPFLYDFVNPVCHWFSYIYIAFILLFLLKSIYYCIDSNTILRKYILKAGKYSYEIFLFQIVFFSVADEYVFKILKYFISNNNMYIISKIIFPVFICTTTVIFYKEKILKWIQNS